MIKWFKNKFKTVYCEDCENCIPSDRYRGSLIGAGDGPMCKAYPLEVDCSETDTFVKRGRKIEIIKTFQRCDNVRCRKRLPLIYDSFCLKFIPKK